MKRSRSGRAAVRGFMWAGLAAAAPILSGCGGGSDAAAAGAPNAGAASPPVVVSGTVTFDRVPVSGLALDYDAVVATPARGIVVEIVAGGAVVGRAETDERGRYSLTVMRPAGELYVRALAEMRRTGTPAWEYRVVDNTQGGALFVLESDPVLPEGSSVTVDLHAASGWDGKRYSDVRAAAPFAILDVVRDATDFVLAAAPETRFPPLTLHWSPSNVPSRGPDGQPNFATGEIGSSLYSPSAGIFLLGAAESDTDEYDRHVIAHEWAHYLEHALGRSDSIGGPHTRGDQLDMRTAFSEGFANAFSAMALGDTRYVDVLGPGQAHGFSFDIEGPFGSGGPNPHPGWFSEESVQEIVYDLFDDEPDTPEDGVALGFGPMLEVLASELRDGRALTSVFAFADALRARRPEQRDAIDALLAAQRIGPFETPYGDGEQNAGVPLDATAVEPGDILPVYKRLEVGGDPVELCSTNAYNYLGETGFYNKLGTRAFARFEAPASGTYRFEAVTTRLPPGATADPDMVLHGAGLLELSEGEPDDALCTPETPEGCAERFERFLGAGEYVLEVYEWTNTQAADAEHAPIGRTCFDVSVSLR